MFLFIFLIPKFQLEIMKKMALKLHFRLYKCCFLRTEEKLNIKPIETITYRKDTKKLNSLL